MKMKKELNLHVVLLFIFLRFDGFAFGQNQQILENYSLSNNEVFLWNSTNYPDAYPFENKTLNITTTEKYFINLRITDLDINTNTSGDKIVITSSESTQTQEITNSSTTYNYTIASNSAIIDFLVYDDNLNESRGFNMIIQQFLNTSANNSIVEDTITVSITGRNAREYNNSATITSLKNVVANMATEYCSYRNWALSGLITADNVNITYLNGCPINWAEASTCVQITFAVPVLLADDILEHQLNSTSLREMWDNLAQRYLSTIGLDVYRERDGYRYLTSWILIFSIILVLFVITMYLVKCLIKRTIYRSARKRSLGDMSTILKERNSVNEFPLGPHPLQDVPPFFQSQIQDFEPGITEAEPTPIYSSNKKLGYETIDESDENVVYSRWHNKYPEGSNV